MVPPELVADHHNVIGALNVLSGQEAPSQGWSNSQHREEACTNAVPGGLYRLAIEHDIPIHERRLGEFRHDIVLCRVGPRHEIAAVEHERSSVVVPANEEHVLGELARAKQDPVSDAEDRGGRPDAERESQDGDQREAAVASKRTKCKAKIGEHGRSGGEVGTGIDPARAVIRDYISRFRFLVDTASSKLHPVLPAGDTPTSELPSPSPCLPPVPLAPPP